jgi:hypothetical protein
VNLVSLPWNIALLSRIDSTSQLRCCAASSGSPSDVARSVTAPALVLDGGASLPFLRDAAKVLAEAMPGGTHRTLEGQTHLPSPETVAPVLVSFFGRR